MKYYSELTKRLYDSQDELIADEKVVDESNEKDKRAQEVEEAREAMNKAMPEYQDKLNAFLKDYGSFRFPSFFNLIDIL